MDNRFFYQSGLTSLGVYFSFLLFLAIYFNYNKDTSESYSFRQDTFFEISLLDLKVKQKKTNIEKQKMKIKNSDVKKIIKEDGSLTHKRGVNFNTLFDNIDDKTNKEKLTDYEIKTSKTDQISRKYGQKANNKSEALNNIDKSLKQIKLPVSYSSNALYNKYYSKISKLLTIEFNRQVYIKGSYRSVVLVVIDAEGKFSYSIDRKSPNDFFNLKLEEFLNNVSKRVFPIYENGQTTIKVVFKIKE